MKKILYSFVVLSFFFSTQLLGQNCEVYFPLKAGTVSEMKNYDAKGKLTGSSKTTVLNNRNIPGGLELDLKMEYFSDKKESMFINEYVARCENGDFYIDMKSYMNGATMGAYQDMKVEVTGDKLKMPKNPKAGDMLSGGDLTVKVTNPQGIPLMTMTTKITNRKVDALETITVPAGTFDCVKISYDMETKMLITIKSHVVEYFSKEVGLVKSESFDKKGKSMGSNVLSSFQK